MPYALQEEPSTTSEFEALTRGPVTTREPHAGPTIAGSAPRVAVLHDFDLAGRPLLLGLPSANGSLQVARSTVRLDTGHRGSDVVVIPHNGDWQRPIVIGVVTAAAAAPATEASVDGDRVLLEARHEVVLRCGDASITLDKAGRVIIQGRYILSRSSGPNKIKGAAIDIN